VFHRHCRAEAKAVKLHALLRARMPQRAVIADIGTCNRPRRYCVRMLEASSTANGHTPTGWGNRPLGIACPCGHRVVIELARLGISSGDMRPLRDRSFVCPSCGSRRVSIWLFQTDDEVAEFLQHGPPPPEPAPPPPTSPIVIDGPAGDFIANGWHRTGEGWVALVDCDRERYRSDPHLVGPVSIGGKRYDCMAVECTHLAKPTIHAGEVIGLVVAKCAQ
jgi:DNA-directed RNA polymerase subunit RPC12/RpoP